jgi:hypothetical protein
MFKIAWRSEDRQGSMPMGEYVSLDVARRELPACLAELLAQCLDDAEDPTGAGGLMTKAACLKGTWVVYDTDDNEGATLEVVSSDVIRDELDELDARFRMFEQDLIAETMSNQERSTK